MTMIPQFLRKPAQHGGIYMRPCMTVAYEESDSFIDRRIYVDRFE